MKTRHALMRAAQRGIKEADIDLIVRYGTQTSGGLIFTRRDLAQAEREAKHLISRLSHLVGKFVATDGDVVITVFHATEQQQRAQLGKRQPAGSRRQSRTRVRAHPARFVRRPPKPPPLPAAAWINPPVAGDAPSRDERDPAYNEATAASTSEALR